MKNIHPQAKLYLTLNHFVKNLKASTQWKLEFATAFINDIYGRDIHTFFADYTVAIYWNNDGTHCAYIGDGENRRCLVDHGEHVDLSGLTQEQYERAVEGC